MYNDCVDNCSTVAENPETVKDTMNNLNEQLIAIRGMATAIYTELFGLCNKCSTDIAPKSPVDCMQDALRDMCTCAAVTHETLKNIIRGLGI